MGKAILFWVRQRATIVFWSLLIIIFVFIVIKFSIINPLELKANHKYTLACVSEIKHVVNGGPIAIFFYCISGKTYSSSADIGNLKRGSISVGNKYLLMYSPKRPGKIRILFEYVAPESLRMDQSNSWDTIPLFIKKDTTYSEWFNN